jgi:hypothetical protein
MPMNQIANRPSSRVAVECMAAGLRHAREQGKRLGKAPPSGWAVKETAS